MKTNTFLVFAAAFAAAIHSANAQLITNGGFETPDTPTYIWIGAGQRTIAPWVVGLHSVEVGDAVGNGFLVGPAFEGAQSLDLNGTGRGRLTQAFATTPGLLYTVTFAHANNYYNSSAPASARVRLFDGLGDRLNQIITHSSSVAGNFNWTVFHEQFTAFQSTTSLEFTSLTDTGGHSGGIMLDAVQVFEVAAVTEAWVQRHGSEAGVPDIAHKVVTDAAGNTIVAGFGGPDMVVTKYSGAGVSLWTNRCTNSRHFLDPGVGAVAVDGSGNVFVTSSLGGGSDMLIIKYSGAGVPLWTNRYNGTGNGLNRATAVVADGSGNVFVTGDSTGSGGYPDYATIAYSGAGVPLWTNRYDGPGNDHDFAYAVALDGSGNVFVTGDSVGSGGSIDYATIAYSGAGVPLWTNRYNGTGNGLNRATAVAVDGGGNVFVTGYSDGREGNEDYATIAYSSAGIPLWTNRYNGPGNGYDFANAAAVDGHGNVFVTGYSVGSGGNEDYATIAYSGAGVPLWTNRYDGTANGSDIAIAVAVDGSGNVFVTGTSSGSGDNTDYATIAYSGAGVPLWTSRYNGSANGSDGANALAVDSLGDVFVTGHSVGSGGDSDFVTVKYVWRPEIAIQLVSTIPPKVNLTLSAAPNSAWAIERALALTGPWTNLSALVIGTNGSAQFQDTNSLYPAGFYRARPQ